MLQKILGVVKSKVFIINAVVIGVLAIVAISLPVLFGDPKDDPPAEYTGAPRLKYTYQQITYGNYRHAWEIEVEGQTKTSWAAIWEEYQAQGEGEKSLTWVITEQSTSDIALLPQAIGLVFAKDSNINERGEGTFTAVITYKDLTITIKYPVT